MNFIDEAYITVASGKGGNGCVSFRREKYIPKGGPDGGDGGDGGDVILRVNPSLSTLSDIRYKKKYLAGNGRGGKGKKMNGERGKSVFIDVPAGTVVYEDKSDKLLADLIHPGQLFVAAKGGKGGKGNARFATSTRQTPDFAERGKDGQRRNLRLELKLLADVGLVGLPNSGKSTLISTISSARPKIADYPFTTLAPNLGIVRYGEYSSFVVADIPGLIEGAHMGKGLGDRFLRHIERTKILVLIIESVSEQIIRDYKKVIRELEAYDISLMQKKRIIALSKTDLLNSADIKNLPLSIDGKKCIPYSSVTREGIKELINEICKELSGEKDE